MKDFLYSKSSDGVRLRISGKDDLHSIDQVLATDILTGYRVDTREGSMSRVEAPSDANLIEELDRA